MSFIKGFLEFCLRDMKLPKLIARFFSSCLVLNETDKIPGKESFESLGYWVLFCYSEGSES